LVLVAVANVAPTAWAQTMDGHKIVSAQKIAWGLAQLSIPPGAQAGAAISGTLVPPQCHELFHDLIVSFD
jgi:hypothetical protein